MATEGYWITSSTEKREVGAYQFTAGSWRNGQKVGDLVRCRQGEPGDNLWIREGWRVVGWDYEDLTALVQYKDGTKKWCEMAPDEDGYDRWLEWLIAEQERIAELPGVTYDYDKELYEWEDDDVIGWKSPIHMPRWATRQVLEVERVRVEQLQDITDAHILKEGVTVDRVAKWTGVPWGDMPELRDAWRVWWNYINDHPRPVFQDGAVVSYVSYPFDGEPRWTTYRGKHHEICPNPWVFVISFAKVAKK